MSRAKSALQPRKKVSTVEWVSSEYYLPKEGADIDGLYDYYYAPYMPGIYEALDDPSVKEVVVMKAAQVGWTFGLIGYLCKVIATMACSIVGMFAKEGAAREFADEKLVPAIESTPETKRLVDVSTSRKSGNRALFKKFPGGFLKLVGSNSPASVKSTPAKIVFVEEPDDAQENLKQQGDSITLLWERTKRQRNAKRIMGGTPTVKGLSRVEYHINLSDKRTFYVPCHDCGESHVLAWENVSWQHSESAHHEVYGDSIPETAIYACPNCGSAWDDYRRQSNVRKGDWQATAQFSGVAGFMELSELYSCLPGATLADMVRDYLAAEYEADHGDQTHKIVFINNKLGRPYEFESDAPDIEDLEARAEDYAELTVPAGGLALTAGVDIQHDRIAITIWAWGRGEEMWLVYWGEIPAKNSTIDKNDPVWKELDKVLFTPIPHTAGFKLMISASSVDSGDGGTNDAVYNYVRPRLSRGVMATKGLSNDYGQREIFSLPKKIDHKTKTKAAKYGLSIFTIGTHKAKDLLIGDRGRISLTGNGPGRMHWYKDVRADFYSQLTAEIKAPHRSIRNKLVWQPKAGVRNEGLDCTVGALHASRSIKVHLMTDAMWDALEAKLKQSDLFANEQQPIEQPAPRGRRVISRGVQ